MRRSDIFKKLTACIITSDQKERGVIIDSLRSIGIKDFIYYPSFKEAYADFTKFYRTADPDFILTDDTSGINYPLNNLPLLVLTKGGENLEGIHSLAKPISGDKLKLAIMNMFKRKFRISHAH